MKIGLALSGGAMKGAAHIGVIQALIENEIDFEIIGGTSAGSIVASLYAMGYTTSEMLKLFNFFAKIVMKNSPTYTRPNGKRGLTISAGGFLSGENISFAINEAAKYKKISKMSDLNKTILITAVDIDTSKKYVFTNSEALQGIEYIRNGRIDMAVRGSCSYPGIFAPCTYMNHKFVDGGILDNIPVNEVKKAGADFVIAVKFALNKKLKATGIHGVTMKSMDIIYENAAKIEVKDADYLLNIDTKDATLWDVKKINDLYRYGYEQTLYKISDIKSKIEEKSKRENA